MIKFSVKILIAISFLWSPVISFAQGSGSTTNPAKSKTVRSDKNNFAITRSISGVVTTTKNSSIVVKSRNGKSVLLHITAKTRVGRCLETGKNVKVIYTPDDAKATLIRCQQ